MVSILRPRSREDTYQWLDRILATAAALVFYFYWLKGGVGTSTAHGGAEATAYSLVQKKGCAPQKGIVVVNFLDFFGWNLLQIGFARRMAEELCWDVSYRTMWKTQYGYREETCFANALTEPAPKALRDELEIDEGLWKALNNRPDQENDQIEEFNDKVRAWASKMEREKKAWKCVTPYCDFSEKSIQRTLERIRATPTMRVVYLESFFAHSDWMGALGWVGRMRNWYKVNPDCCTHQPPSDAVVIHISDTTDNKMASAEISATAYDALLEKYGWKKKPIWVVCDDQESRMLPVVKELESKYQAKVVPRGSHPEILCTLMRARILIMTPNSILSWVAGILNSGAEEVHMPMQKGVNAQYAFNISDWKYHLYDSGKFTDWDVPHSTLPLGIPWVD